MNKKKDYIDEHEEWQRHQFDPGHFTGGRIPVWIKNPGNRKGLGSVLLILGLMYGGQTIYTIITAPQLLPSIFLGFASVIFLLAGITLFRKPRKK